MASVPQTGDRLIAKVKMMTYQDDKLEKEMLPVPPGPNGLRKSWQYPNIKEKDEEVGTFTGMASEKAYQVNSIMVFDVAIQKLFRWSYITIVKNVTVWVRKEEVTGGWDKGVDAPKIKDDDQKKDPPPADNTNLYLAGAIGAALIAKFILPKR